ncbi:MAG: DNA-binding protein [Chloroflexi bacterium]|nr:DNA-binding protein [Chloroflexota bacterium]
MQAEQRKPLAFPAPLADDQLLTRQQAADVLCISLRKLDDLTARGRLPVVRVTPAMVRIRRSTLSAFIDNAEQS